MPQETVIELYKENLEFSAGHFAIFSATERENMHGHNYSVSAAISNTVFENGFSFDYRYYKKIIYQLCQQLSQTFLLPTQSKYLRLEAEEDPAMLFAYFGDEKIPFLKRDVTLVPLCNITVEELSRWFIEKLTQDHEVLAQHHISKIIIKVFSGTGQSGSAQWLANNA